ncbi:LysR substrate-binding domain-containing protein [Mycolicibacterium bacteremicum]|uniref:LysR family transcriptional regulator n=1 Tax=Mycolicibacterium bacteremicum TaxID=564198 RepID=A0A1W9YP18_MYCBA|nr:LysR substrate-binding domain-containing protein [Mycolicibacterium bacteremicum]MCV7430374.1 LysR family transcriptional regulator [Mycolicibacterium bacteremicum]ORA01808.1 LysR family transcriptional regulator [Mycolicibacterium bacteremicum]
MDRWSGLLAPQLRALDELVACDGHMTRAAERLGIPQSSMSRRIHTLQKTLGVVLIVADGRAVRLTPAAVRLAGRIRDPLRALESGVESVAADADAEHGTVRFGFPLTMGAGRLPGLIAEFHRRAPGIRLHLKQAHGSQLAADLRSAELDVAVLIPPPDGLRHSVIGTQLIHAVLPAGHRLAARRRIRLTELREEIFIANPASYNLRRLTEDWCEAVGFAPAVALEITEFATIRELIARGLGVALLPHDGRTAPGTVEIALSPTTYQREIALAWSDTAVTPASQRFLAFVRDRF